MLVAIKKLWQQHLQKAGQDLKKATESLDSEIGGKAAKLARLASYDFDVPLAWAINKSVYQSYQENKELPEELITQLKDTLDLDKEYAVRSSSLFEDLEDASFAGQYHTSLRAKGLEAICEGIIACYQSLQSEKNLQYMVDKGIAQEDLAMGVLIQEMVEADVAGVLFTVDPVTGMDTEILAEVTYGTGEKLVSGETTAHRYRYDWWEEEYLEEPKERILYPDVQNGLMELGLRVQEHFGHPVDIEFAIKSGDIHLLQARPITAVAYQAFEDLWSTADFKDGGVSASVCKPLMWGLYEYIWETKLRSFIIESKILPPRDVQHKLGDMFYGRPYWNLSTVKLGMSKIPGYIERDFDMEYGVRRLYEGEGHKTRVSPRSVIHVGRIALAQKRILKQQALKLEDFLEEREAKYQELKSLLKETQSPGKLAILWYYLTNVEYLETEGTYFWQIFINTIHQSLYKEKIRKYVSESSYLSLLGGLEDISHLRPFYVLWDWSREIRKSEEEKDYWLALDSKNVVGSYKENPASFHGLDEFLDSYGYHSDKELDISYPNYHEDPGPVVRALQEFIRMEDKDAPFAEQEQQKLRYEEALEELASQTKGRKQKKLLFTVEEMRSMLWWREELRDMSTKYYDLIRRYTLVWSVQLEKEAVLDSADDIWFLTLEELWAFIKGEKEAEAIREAVVKHKRYYHSFENYKNKNEIGRVFSAADAQETVSTSDLAGLACNAGVIEGTARVISGLEDIDRLEPGDILVTKYTDTGWTAKFAILSGIITEYGGLLCHAAIVSREYGLPCIVHAEDVMQKIPDGAKIRMDGSTGKIEIISK